jgi:hypothetical protein
MWFRINSRLIRFNLYDFVSLIFRTWTLFSVKMVVWVGMFLPWNNSALLVLPIRKNWTMESFHRGMDTLQTRNACGSITGSSFNLFTQVLVCPVKPTLMKGMQMDSPFTTSNMSRGLNSSDPWMMNWLGCTSRFTMNIPALELFGLVLRLCLFFRLCVHLCLDFKVLTTVTF